MIFYKFILGVIIEIFYKKVQDYLDKTMSFTKRWKFERYIFYKKVVTILQKSHDKFRCFRHKNNNNDLVIGKVRKNVLCFIR